MRIEMKKVSGLAVLVAFLANHDVWATGAVAGATEPTQILNNVQLVASYGEQAQQTVQQIQMYQTMLKNLVQMTPSSLLDQSAQKLFQDQNMLQTFRNLRNIVVNGQSLSYSLANIDAQFRKVNPGYGQYTRGFDFQSAYQDWSNNTIQSVENSMSVVSAHADDFDTEQGMVNELSNISSSAQGQLQAMQAGHQIGIATISQLQKLRQLQMAQMQVQNAYVSAMQGRLDTNRNANSEILNQIPSSNRFLK